jgi:DNA-directed RNA polymerase specialized sigma24 family protein
MLDPVAQSDDVRSSHSVTDALLRWKAGDEAAQFDLKRGLHQLELELIRHVRRNRGGRLAARIDSQAIVNKALCGLLMGARADAFPELRDRANVRKLLFDMVSKALRQEIRDNKRVRRQPDREMHDESMMEHLPCPATYDAFAPSSDDGAAQPSLVAEEFLEYLRRRVRPIHEKAMDIVELLLEGWSSGEIARNLDMGQRNVQNIIKKMRDAWFGDDWREGDTDDARDRGRCRSSVRPVGALQESVPHGLPVGDTPCHPSNPRLGSVLPD